MKWTKYFSALMSILLIVTMALVTVPTTRSLANEPDDPITQVDLSRKEPWSRDAMAKLGYVPDQVLVKLKEAVDLRSVKGRETALGWLKQRKSSVAEKVLDRLVSNGRVAQADAENLPNEFTENYLKEKEQLRFANIIVVELASNDVVLETASELMNEDIVEYAEPNYIVQAGYTPNESFYTDNQLWGLDNDGSTIVQGDADNSPSYATNNPGISAADIHIDEAWNKLTGNETEIIVAVLDTGVDYDHEDLDGVMWSPSGSCYDEDDNVIMAGCPNHGWNYDGGSSNDPDDDNDHGTHVAGIIGAEHSAGDTGVVGASKNVAIMAVKFLDSSKSGTVTDEIKAINFAKNNGANIINASYYSTSDSATEEDAIEGFVDEGGLFITIAGNDNDDIDSGDSAYPAAYDLDGASFDNLVTVTAVDQAFDGATFSNYGSTSVDIGAPGTNILSTVIGDGYEFMDGTSMAAPFVSGSAALIWSYRPDLTAQQVKLAIMESGDSVADLNPSTGSHPTVTGDAVDAYDAMLATEEALVVPTITSTAGGGNWNSTSTWEGGVVPTSTDVVEINGTVTLNTSPTIAGLIVNSGKTLTTPASGTYALTLSGADADLENNGTITDYSSGNINLVVGGNMENNGTFSPNAADLAGNLVNSGTISINTYVEGKVKNSGTISLNVILDGSTDQTIEGSGTFGYLTISNDAEVISDITLTYSSTISAGKILTIDTGKILTTNTGLYNSGTVNGGTIRMNGAGSQTISGTGPLNIDELWVANGTVGLSTNVDLNGNLKVSSGATLQANYGRYGLNYTLDVDGDVDNDGTIQSTMPSGTYWGELDLTVSGNVDNSGSILYNSVGGMRVDIEGDFTNSGTHSVITLVAGDVNNTGTATMALYLDGTSAQSLAGAGTFGSFAIQNDTTTNSDITATSNLTIYAGKTLTIGNTYTFTANGGLYNSGTLTGDTFRFNGTDQYFGTCGTINLTSILIDNGTTKLNTNCELTADVTVETGAILQSNYTHRILTIHGDLTVNGTTQNDGGNMLTIYLDSDLDNNGTMNHYLTFADWEPVVDADSYEFQLTDTSDVWQTEVSTGANTFYNITAYEADDRRWRWRSVDNGTPSDWSSDKYIN